MAEVFIRFGDDRHKKGSIKLNRFAKKTPRNLISAFNTVGEILERQVVTNLSGESHTRNPNTSNPFHGVVTGNLKRSAMHKPLKPFGVMIAVGGLAKDYTLHQEELYPYMKPAWDKQEDKVMQILLNAIRKPLK